MSASRSPRSRRSRSVARIAAVAALLLLAAAVAGVALAARPDARSAFADGPQGLSQLLDQAGSGARVVSSTPLLLRGDGSVDPAHTLLVVTGAARAYTAEEADAFHHFLEAGGHAIVAEEDGQAGALTGAYGITFERVPVLSPHGDTETTFHLASGDVTVPVRLPTALSIADGSAATPVAATSADAFIDRDSDGAFSVVDPAGPFTVAATVPVGGHGGQLWAVASVDLLSNRASADPAVRDLRAALLAAATPEDGRVLVDESHHRHDAATLAAAWAVRATSQTPLRWGLLAAALLAAGAVAFRSALLAAWGPHRHDPDRFRSRRDADTAAGAGPGGPNGDDAAGPDPASTVTATLAGAGAADPEAARPARRAWTQRAALAAGASLALLVAGAVARSATALAAGLALAAPLAAAAAGRRPKVEVTRVQGSDRVPEGTVVPVRLDLVARRGGDLELRDGVPAEAEVAGEGPWRRLLLSRGQRLELGYEVRPVLRGPHQLGPLRVRSSDPFRLRAWDVPAGEPGQIRVLPRRDPLKRVKLPVRRPDLLMGAHPVNRAGEGTEFQALREYQAGDAMRMVNWKASARSKGLMVNLRVLESQTLFTLLLDARAVSDSGPARSTPLAASARAAVSIASAAAQGRDRVRFASFGSDLAELPPAPSQRFLHLLADHLATVQATGAMRFDAVAARLLPNIKPGTPVALFSGLEGDAGFGAGARTLIGRGASLTVFAFPIATEAPGVPPEPGAAELHAQRARNVQELRGAGATVHEVRGDLPLEVLLRMQGVTR
jgi:uncharacterized protein (DUF58 family)